MSKVNALYHIVFCTYGRQMTIPESSKRLLYAYLYGILKASKCYLWRMNGIGNHIHVLISLPPTLALSALMQKLKQSSSLWLKDNPDFPSFYRWAKEYYACTISESAKDSVIEYIKNQESHHLYPESLNEEFRALGFITDTSDVSNEGKV